MKAKGTSRFPGLMTCTLAILLIQPINGKSQITLGGVNMGKLTDYLFAFTNGSLDANWQAASKGYLGNVAVDGIQADERTSGNIPFSGIIYTNDANLGSWQSIIDDNSGQASAVYNETGRIAGLEADLSFAFAQINALPFSPGYGGVSAISLNGLNTQNGVAETVVINISSGMNVSTQINIRGDAGDYYILRWDSDSNASNGYQGEVKFQSGGAIVPQGGLKATNFINVAGNISSSGGGDPPPPPYPQGPRYDEGLGALINNGSDFGGGGYFTGYWLTTGDPADGKTSSLSNAVFVGGWYTNTTSFSMTSGTSGVHLSPPSLRGSIGDRAFKDTDGDGIQDNNEMGLANVVVSLYDASNNLIATRTTNAQGNYIFTDLAVSEAGINYQVQFTRPPFHVISPQNADGQGIPGPLNSDPNTITTRTGNITLTHINPSVNYVDAGLIGPENTTLPFNKLELRATAYGSIVELNWFVDNELNTNRFVMQRSTDGVQFIDLGSVNATGSQNTQQVYKANDDIQSIVSSNIIHYRIKSVGNDQRFSYSNIAVIRLNKTGGIRVWPNPFVADIRISYEATVDLNLDIRIFDNTGRTVKSVNYSVVRGLNQVQINGMEHLPAGTYFINISDNKSNKVLVEKLSK